MRRLLFLVLLLLWPLLVARPAAPPVAEYEKWTIDDVVNQESATDFQLSPDGRFALWTRSVPDKEKNETLTQLHRIDLSRHREVQLTRGNDSCSSGRWSPDGDHVAFLSSRPAPRSKDDKPDDKSKSDDDPRTQIWLLDTTGGEPWPITESSRGVQRFGWAGNDAIVFAAQEEPTRRETTLKDDRKDTTTVVEDERNEPPVRLFRVEIKTKKITRLSRNRDRIEQLAVSPDGKHAVAIHGRSLRYLYDNRVKPLVVLHDLTTGESRSVFTDPKLNISHLAWAPDGKGIYATNEHSSKPHLQVASVTHLYYLDRATGKETRLDLDWPRGLARQDDNGDAPGIVPLKDGFLALLADGARHRAARYTRRGDGHTRAWLTGEHERNLFGLAPTVDGKTLLYAHSTASSPTRWYHARLDGSRIGKAKAIAECNDFLAKRRIARSEVVRWKGARNEDVEGILYYPHRHDPNRRAPLVVQIHGGPAAADHDGWEERWAYSANLVCQRGAFVLKPNYHGSAGYGQAWLESIADGRYCEPELEDIEKGVDALIARGLVDAKRLALSGWSNGAILTNELITRTTRYRAAVAGAGTIEYVSDWASCEFGEAFDRFYLGKSPLEDLPLYLRKSPFHRLDRVRTPTLILFGAEDRVVHPQQGWAQFRALQQLGKTPVRFVLFPGEKHGLRKRSHQRRKLEEELAWLDRHLFGSEKPSEVIVKDDSPLKWRLARQSARRVGSQYGVSHDGLLVPETVKYGSLFVGRFEVTRAQFARFDPGQRVEPGTENHPASGIGYEQARGYCVWLSKKTGKRYRLPTEAEADDLYEKPAEGDNTLDAWAGYAVNPEDAGGLREKLKKLGGVAPLLREVGAGRGVGKEDLVYDLGGNVAEWVQGKKGQGVLRGGSADSPADSKNRASEATPAYRGFRIILD